MAKIDILTKKVISKKWIFLGLISSIILISTSLFLLLYPFPSKEKGTYTNMEHPIIYKGEIFTEEAYVESDTVYLPISFVKEYIDPAITIDEKSDSIILTTKDKVIQLPNEKLQYYVNEEPMNLEFPLLKKDSGELFLNLEPLKTVYPFQVKYVEETGIVLIERDGLLRLNATINENGEAEELRLREKPTVTSSYLASVKPNEEVWIEQEHEGFYYIRKKNGLAGYLKKEWIILGDPEMVNIKNEKVGLPNKPAIKWPISLTWEAVYTKNPDTSKIPAMAGVNVVSPTWFSIKNGAGDIENLASKSYVEWAKSKNYQVWALFSNDFDPKLTHESLKDFDTRQKMIKQLVSYSEMYELDGINVDFENVNYEDRKLVTQFMRELTVYLHQIGLIVSMDVTFISSSENWSKFYEREELAEIVDYIMVMAYDEHWGTSPEAGSVASLPWVEKNLKQILEVVPNERLVLGVPLYSRIWKEQQTEGGNIEVSSTAHSMDEVKAWLEEHAVTYQYDEKTGQNYAEYYNEKEKATYKVWIEDETSMAKRMQLVHKYELAGIASWSRYFASDEIWGHMDRSLKQREVVKKEDKE